MGTTLSKSVHTEKAYTSIPPRSAPFEILHIAASPDAMYPHRRLPAPAQRRGSSGTTERRLVQGRNQLAAPLQARRQIEEIGRAGCRRIITT